MPIDWTRAVDGQVPVHCPDCPEPRMMSCAAVHKRMASPNGFTGRCVSHMVRTRRTEEGSDPPHPAVDWTRVLIGTRHEVAVACPKCGEVRWRLPQSVAAYVRKGSFTGLCLPCSPQAKVNEWTELGDGRRIDPEGYVRLSRAAVSEEDLWLYHGLRGSRYYVFEHRLAMSRVLSRPLHRNELVDHRDGVKTNNDPSNLRIYLRGQNEEGSSNGYGTYYDEWQRALAEIKRLRESVHEGADGNRYGA